MGGAAGRAVGPGGRPAGMSLLRNRNFTLVLAGQVASLFGGSVQRVALSLYLLQLTGSAGTYSLVTALSVVPYIVLAPLAGAVADAFNRRSIMIALDVLCCALLVGYGAALFAGAGSVSLAAAVMVALSACSAFYNPAVTACLPQIVELRGLAAANSAVSQVSAWSNILGPVAAGVLFGAVGIEWIVAGQAACFAASAFAECFIKMPPPDPGPDGRRRPSLAGSFAGMGSFVRMLRRDYPVTLGIILSYGMYNVFVVPINSVLFPSAMMLDLGVPSEVYGTVEGVVAAGMLLAGVLVSLRPRWFSFATSYRWNYPLPVLLFAMGAVLAAGSHAGVAVAVMAACGMGVMFILGVGNIVTLTYNQTTVPVSMLGSLSALSTAFSTSSTPVGQVVFGQLIEAGCPNGALLWSAAAVCCGVCCFVRWNTRRANGGAAGSRAEMRTPAPPPDDRG